MQKELHKGFAIIVDDLLPNSTISESVIPEKIKQDDIFKIINQVEKKEVPFHLYNKIPSDESIEHFDNINFIVLDWKLYPENSEISIPDGVIESNNKSNIKFIDKIKQKCFCPIFIFSTESKQDIIDVLEPAQLYDIENDERNFILIKNKSELVKSNNLFELIEEWIKNHPSIYLLKKWEHSFLKAKNKTFWNLFNRSPLWPAILWETSEKDNVDPASNLYEIIFKTIKARTQVGSLDEKTIKEEKPEVKLNYNEIMDVIRGIMFIENDYLEIDHVKPGDVFKIEEENKYYFNVRPECDTVKDRTDGNIYLISGEELNGEAINKSHYKEPFGIIEKLNESIVMGLDNKNAVLFKFKKIKIMKFTTIQNKRICRIIPPYSTFILQKFNAYMSRVGKPRYPDQIIDAIITAPPPEK